MRSFMDRTPDTSEWKPEWSRSVDRVASLVESVFSCRVRFQTLETFLNRTTSDFLDQDLIFLESTLFEPPAVLRGTRSGLFAFSLRVRRQGASPTDVSLVGMAIIEGLAAGDDARLEQLGEFLQLAVESKLEAFERLLDLEQQEERLKSESEQRTSSKIIQLFPRENLGKEPFHLRNYDDGLNIQKPLLLVAPATEADRPFAFNRLALELFNRTSLWFFVNLADLGEDVFQSAQAFQDLGRMCIFVPNLAEVSIEKQLRLAEVFGPGSMRGSAAGNPAGNSKDTPRLIAGLTDFPIKLIQQGVLLPHLVEQMTTVDIDLGSDIRQALRKVESTLNGGMNPLSPTSKKSNLIPLLNRWKQDDSTTFH